MTIDAITSKTVPMLPSSDPKQSLEGIPRPECRETPEQETWIAIEPPQTLLRRCEPNMRLYLDIVR